MKTTVNLIDDPRPGGIRSLLDDMRGAGLWPDDRWQVRAVDSCARIRLGKDVDTIVVHYSMAWRKLPALALLRRSHPSARLVIVEHHYTAGFEDLHVASPRRFRALLRLCYGLADDVVAVSAAQARWLRSAGVVAGTKLRTIPVCRNYEDFLAVRRTRKTGGPLVVGALGRLEAVKGFDLLIEAMADLPDRQYRLRIAGDGSLRDALQARAAGRGNIEFVGHLDEPAPFLASCDVLAVPSRHEAFGLVCAEGKATGLPVIVSDVDGLPEQAHDCGLVFESENVKALREAIISFAQPGQLERYRDRARASVVNAWSHYLAAWSALLA